MTFQDIKPDDDNGHDDVIYIMTLPVLSNNL